MKACFKCGAEKPLSEYYKHNRMADGHLGKCKECTKADVKDNRAAKVDYYRKYDRVRGNRQTAAYREAHRERFPNSYMARYMVSNAIRDGKMLREPCVECGSMDRVHAHHDDYAKPLSVRWMCAAHHKQWHQKNGAGKNRT